MYSVLMFKHLTQHGCEQMIIMPPRKTLSVFENKLKDKVVEEENARAAAHAGKVTHRCALT